MADETALIGSVIARTVIIETGFRVEAAASVEDGIRHARGGTNGGAR